MENRNNFKVFIDTSALVALAYGKDQYHPDAHKIWQNLINQKAILFTSNYVVAETITLARKRAGFQVSVQVGNLLLRTRLIEIIRPDEKQEFNAWEIYKKYSDKELSFADFISFSLMKEINIKKAFAFDEHFLQLGFQII